MAPEVIEACLFTSGITRVNIDGSGYICTGVRLPADLFPSGSVRGRIGVLRFILLFVSFLIHRFLLLFRCKRVCNDRHKLLLLRWRGMSFGHFHQEEIFRRGKGNILYFVDIFHLKIQLEITDQVNQKGDDYDQQNQENPDPGREEECFQISSLELIRAIFPVSMLKNKFCERFGPDSCMHLYSFQRFLRRSISRRCLLVGRPIP